MNKWGIIIIVGILSAGFLAFGFIPLVSAQDPAPASGDVVELGRLLFFDESLSVTQTQSCATCHGPEVGFTGPDSLVNQGTVVYMGAIENRYGNRKPPSSAYGGDSPVLYFDETAGEWVGGMFWDGRATGWTLGDPLAEQAQGPFLNPLEHAMPNPRLVVIAVANSEYAGLFEQVWGEGSLDFIFDVEGSYERIGRSISAYERSAEVNPFSSKFDLFWDNAAAANKDVTLIKFGNMMDPNRWQTYRNLGLSDSELMGLAAFNDPNRANCASCHSLNPGSAGYPLFTNFTYDNVGLPKNPDNPFYEMPRKWNPDGKDWIDTGLGGFLKSAGYPPEVYGPEIGKFRVPSLRNVDRRPSESTVKAYGHNGYFKSLEEIVMFYHWRGMMDGGCMGGGMGGGMGCGGMGMDRFPPPEVSQNLAAMEMFNGMDRNNIVTFLKTLSDGYIQP